MQKVKCNLKLVFLLSVAVGVLGWSTPKAILGSGSDFEVMIIPKPQFLAVHDGTYQLPKMNRISYTGYPSSVVEELNRLLQSAQLEHDIIKDSKHANFILLQDDALKGDLGEEGYILDVQSDGVKIQAATDTGIFYGIQSLRQLLPASIEDDSIETETLIIPYLHIKDVPKYSWRGNMIDIARSHFGMDYLKKHLDRMALYKMNRLHLHLTDDQGWRLELKSKPLLTEIGGKSAVKNGRSGYLTTEEYKQLQAYAMERHIIIIPEIDLPGHSYAALVSYPELNCEDLTNLNPKMASPPELFDGYKVGWSKLCLTKPEVYDFVADVFKEVAEMTIGPWIHIGGDEIKDDLYEPFVVKADSMVRSHGKISIGWEEVSKANMSSDFISQRWNAKTTPLRKSKVIESICTSFYFDHANVTGQEKTNNWCKKSGVSLEDVYNFNDKPDEIIGVEAPVWTELVVTDAMLDNRLWPRLIAVAEIGWSPSHDDFEDFTKRLKVHHLRLDALQINYFLSEVHKN